MGWPRFDGLDDFDEIHAVTFGEYRPLVQECQNGCAVGILNNLGGLGLNRPIQHRQRELFDIEHLIQKLHHALSCLTVAPRADPPEIADAADIILARHDPLEAVGKHWLCLDAAGSERLFEDRPGYELRGAGSHCCLDKYEAFGLDLLTDRLQRGLKRCHLGLPGFHRAQVVLGVITLNVHYDAICQAQAVGIIRGRERLLFQHATGDHRVHLGILGLYR